MVERIGRVINYRIQETFGSGGSIVVHVGQLKPWYTRKSWETTDGVSAAAAQEGAQLDSALGDEGLTHPEPVIDTEPSGLEGAAAANVPSVELPKSRYGRKICQHQRLDL